MSNQFNILNLINNFPPSLSNYLSNNDAENLIHEFGQNQSLFEKLNLLAKKNIIAKAALEDHRIAMNEICLENPNRYGQAKWSILQFVEKIMKSIIQLKEPSINLKKHSHNISNIDQDIQKVYKISTKADLLKHVRGIAEIRYGQQVSRLEAIKSYKSAMEYLHDLLVDNLEDIFTNF